MKTSGYCKNILHLDKQHGKIVNKQTNKQPSELPSTQPAGREVSDCLTAWLAGWLVSDHLVPLRSLPSRSKL